MLSQNMRFASLNALRAFEAAGRYGSFTLAANELNVTPGAISRHIRTLEEALGEELFIRSHRRVSVSPTGLEFHRSLTAGFATIETATTRFMSRSESTRVVVACPVLFATNWLFPRMREFQERFPKHEVVVRPQNGIAFCPRDLEASDLVVTCDDVATGMTEDGISLFRSPAVLVCSPKLLNGSRPLQRPEDLRQQTLIETGPTTGRWERLFGKMALGSPALGQVVAYTNPMISYEATVHGLGVALIGRAFVGDDLANGRLIQPLDEAAIEDGVVAIRKVRPSSRSKVTRDFMAWITRMARREQSPSQIPVQDRRYLVAV
ncbi:LysR substrate-binding domain-containing protein [Aminobacter sp. MSH1]|uniref:LysR substrate-binding domain-containing protein n=1 Tax=Aminobacter sp. MSH1 TaxID=374606 RepID=UPI00131F177C|nr:LysR substrate-binding domain-containing protein [Aminobacter sp. MSH1]